MAPGDVVLISFPFSNQVEAKLRPVLVLGCVGTFEIVVSQITTSRMVPNAIPLTHSDMVTGDIDHPCFINPLKISTLETSKAVQHLGNVSEEKFKSVVSTISKLMRYPTIQ